MIELVRQFYMNVQFELGAVPLSGALERAEDMGRFARAMSDALMNRGSAPPMTEVEADQAEAAVRFIVEARRTARETIKRRAGLFMLPARRRRCPLEWFALWEELSEFASAAEQVAKALRSGRTGRAQFRDGEAWRLLAQRLHLWAKSNGLPHTIRKDSAETTSPFVYFFRALQDEFPPQFRRHHASGSLQALAQAINSAVRAKREE